MKLPFGFGSSNEIADREDSVRFHRIRSDEPPNSNRSHRRFDENRETEAARGSLFPPSPLALPRTPVSTFGSLVPPINAARRRRNRASLDSQHPPNQPIIYRLGQQADSRGSTQPAQTCRQICAESRGNHVEVAQRETVEGRGIRIELLGFFVEFFGKQRRI